MKFVFVIIKKNIMIANRIIIYFKDNENKMKIKINLYYIYKLK